MGIVLLVIGERDVDVWVGRRVGYLATTFALKEHYRPI